MSLLSLEGCKDSKHTWSFRFERNFTVKKITAWVIYAKAVGNLSNHQTSVGVGLLLLGEFVVFGGFVVGGFLLLLRGFLLLLRGFFVGCGRFVVVVVVVG